MAGADWESTLRVPRRKKPQGLLEKLGKILNEIFVCGGRWLKHMVKGLQGPAAGKEKRQPVIFWRKSKVLGTLHIIPCLNVFIVCLPPRYESALCLQNPGPWLPPSPRLLGYLILTTGIWFEILWGKKPF